jgi:hypothetical protein
MARSRTVILAHHKPDRTDQALDQLAGRLGAGTAGVIVGAEGEMIDL